MEDFSNTFGSKEAMNANEDDFDPFNIGVASPPKAPDLTALPPKFMVNFKIEEEVSSVAHLSDEYEGSSDVQIEGTVLVSFSKGVDIIVHHFLYDEVPRKSIARNRYLFIFFHFFGFFFVQFSDSRFALPLILCRHK